VSLLDLTLPQADLVPAWIEVHLTNAHRHRHNYTEADTDTSRQNQTRGFHHSLTPLEMKHDAELIAPSQLPFPSLSRWWTACRPRRVAACCTAWCCVGSASCGVPS
jgi:hypothetical protein